MQPTIAGVRRSLARGFAGLIATLVLTAAANAAPPVLIGLDAEFGNKTSTADDAIQAGAEIAIEDINAAGGVLGGRPLELIVRDNRGVPARGVDNLRELAALPDLVAVMGAKFSPVMLAQLPLAQEIGIVLLDPWAAADKITIHDHRPSYSYRLSLRDGWVMPFLMDEARSRGLRQVGLLVPNGAWGRSNLRAAEQHARSTGQTATLVKTIVYEWADESLENEYQALVDAGAEAIVLVANEPEAAKLAKAMLGLPRERWRPVLSHWGAAAGPLPNLVGSGLFDLDLSFVQTYSFVGQNKPLAQHVANRAMQRLGVTAVERLPSPPGIAHAYDLTQLLARAINLAGSTDRPAIRNALERLPAYDGLVRRYDPAFTASRHDALGPENLFLVRWSAEGGLLPVARKTTR